MQLQVFTYEQAAKRAAITLRTLQRLLAAGLGPATVELSTRRRGILADDFEAWLLSRRRPAPGEKAA